MLLPRKTKTFVTKSGPDPPSLLLDSRDPVVCTGFPPVSSALFTAPETIKKINQNQIFLILYKVWQSLFTVALTFNITINILSQFHTLYTPGELFMLKLSLLISVRTFLC